jgi:hypothetical protein
VAALFALVLGAVAMQVVLIGGQRELDRLAAEIEVERTRHDALRRQESELRSPAEIRDIAIESLGMVPAEAPLLVAPPSRVVGYPAGDPRGAATPTTVVAPSSTAGAAPTAPSDVSEPAPSAVEPAR